ncbi:hypothetical protein KK120_18725 [Virgibacillus dakarensis]|nr:hypothetical protein [Virgibacillus dakarensis]
MNRIIEGEMIPMASLTVKLWFMELYKHIKKGTADPEYVEEMLFAIYQNEHLYLMVEEDDLMWKRLQEFERYMNKHGVFYD